MNTQEVDVQSDYYHKIGRAVFTRIGIKIPADKHYLLRARLEKVMRDSAYGNLGTLWENLESGNEIAWEHLTRHITTTHTYFFREADHFDHAVKHFVDSGIRTPSIWCAASSSGEEPYSLAMMLLENGISEFRLVASDINKTMLRNARAGIYDQVRLEQTSPIRRQRWFKKVSESSYLVAPELREHIRLKHLNIIEPVQFEQQFDAVFCRNVMIYFDRNTINRAVNNLCANLKLGGLFFVGKTESLIDKPPYLEKVAASAYRKKEMYPQ